MSIRFLSILVCVMLVFSHMSTALAATTAMVNNPDQMCIRDSSDAVRELFDTVYKGVYIPAWE